MVLKVFSYNQCDQTTGVKPTSRRSQVCQRCASGPGSTRYLHTWVPDVGNRLAHSNPMSLVAGARRAIDRGHQPSSARWWRRPSVNAQDVLARRCAGRRYESDPVTPTPWLAQVQLVGLQTICGSELDDKVAFVVATMWRPSMGQCAANLWSWC